MKNKSAGNSLHAGKEQFAQDEDGDIKKIIEVFKKTLPKYYLTGTVKRMFHPKTHGLLKASFIVREDLENEYRTGLFQPGAQYPMWCRLSNAKKKPSPDANKDMRGMALKLFEVKGEKLLEHDKNAVTQDFLLITSKTLQTRSVKDFQKSLTTYERRRKIIFVCDHPSCSCNALDKTNFKMQQSVKRIFL
ncbi:MAG: catalase [Chitinophagales bacterium]|nr:catalase [Chitinophagales bacterium]